MSAWWNICLMLYIKWIYRIHRICYHWYHMRDSINMPVHFIWYLHNNCNSYIYYDNWDTITIHGTVFYSIVNCQKPFVRVQGKRAHVYCPWDNNWLLFLVQLCKNSNNRSIYFHHYSCVINNYRTCHQKNSNLRSKALQKWRINPVWPSPDKKCSEFGIKKENRISHY